MSGTSDQTTLNGVREWSGSATRQRKWDWRAAANFIGGGSGSGLLIIAAAVAVVQSDAYAAQVWVALGLISAGLLCVMAKIGHPGRAFNAMRHADTSWMTRELLTVPFIYLSALAMLHRSAPAWLAVAPALAALGFLYCQARILAASRGIPVWSEPAIVPLVVVTGLTEGAGLSVGSFALVSGSASALLLILFAGLLVLRQIVWVRYRSALAGRPVPKRAREVLDRFAGHFTIFGQASPALLALAALPMDETAGVWLSLLAGAMAVAGGWALKHTLIIRAAYTHGVSLPVRRIRSAVR